MRIRFIWHKGRIGVVRVDRAGQSWARYYQEPYLSPSVFKDVKRLLIDSIRLIKKAITNNKEDLCQKM